MRVLCIFFHPRPSITALGGAEKRFLETSRAWLRRGIDMTVIEPEPYLSHNLSTRYENGKLPVISYSERSWSIIYLGWMLWMLTAFSKGASAVLKSKPEMILATNNTLPSLIPAYLIHVVFRLPLGVVVHHVDIPSPDA